MKDTRGEFSADGRESGKTTSMDRKRKITAFEGRILRDRDLPSKDNAIAYNAEQLDGLSTGRHGEAEAIALWLTGHDKFPDDLSEQVSLLKRALLAIADKHISVTSARPGGRTKKWPIEQRLLLLGEVDRLKLSKAFSTNKAALECLRQQDAFLSSFEIRRLETIVSATRTYATSLVDVLAEGIEHFESRIRDIEKLLPERQALGFRRAPRATGLAGRVSEDMEYLDWLSAKLHRLVSLSRKL